MDSKRRQQALINTEDLSVKKLEPNFPSGNKKSEGAGGKVVL